MRHLLLFIIFLTFSKFLQAQGTNSGKELYDQAKNFISQGDFSNGILVFNQAIQKEPKNLLYRRELSFAYFLQGDLLHAAQMIFPLMKSPDADPETFLLASKIFRKMGRLDEALDAIHRGIKKFPDQGMLYEENGQVLLEKKKNKEAVQVWEKGIKKSPEYYLNYYDLSRAYFYNKDYIWAILYGEHFVNMESFSTRTEEIKKIIFESYKSLIADLNSDEMKNVTSNPNTFEESYCSVISELKPLVMGGIHLENLSILRLRFMFIWNRDYAKRFPLELIDYQQRMILKGCYEGYTMWLFGKADNEQKMNEWITNHSDLMNTFDEYLRLNKLQPKTNQYYHN